MKIALLRHDHLGDLLLTTPLIRSLAKAGHGVDVVARKTFIPLFVGSPYAKSYAMEEIAPDFPKRWMRLGRWLRARSYDAVIIPYGRPTQLLAAARLSGAPRRIAMWGGIAGRLLGFQCLRSGIQQGCRHFSDILLDVARALNATPDGLALDYFPTPDELAWASRQFRSRWGDRPVLIVHPGHNFNTCNVSPAFYGEVVRNILRQTQAGIIITGVASECQLVANWPRDVMEHPRLWNAIGAFSVRELAACIARSSVVAVVGTGPLHIASALHVPSVSPFCLSPALCPTVWGSICPNAVVLTPPAEHCNQRTPKTRNCAMDQWIAVDSMVTHIRRHLEAPVQGLPP